MSQELLMRHNPRSSAAGDPKVNGSWGPGLGVCSNTAAETEPEPLQGGTCWCFERD